MTAPLIEVDQLTFRYRRATEPAVRGLDLRVEAGQVLLVAGPSGCGKSTLIRAINGLIPHSYPGELTGAVRIAGRSTVDQKLRDIALTVGTVLQDPAKQIVGATVEAELAFGPENIGIPRDEIRARVEEVMVTAGIGALAGRATHDLSGGERQLLAVGGILMLRPSVLVVDEPLANLDPRTAGRLLGILRHLADEGAAVIIVEHRVEEALDLQPDRVLYLDSGSTSYLGDVPGFLAVADPSAVKLPFEVILSRAGDAMPDAGSTPGPPPAPSPPATAPPRLEFRGVDAGYPEHRVLQDVSVALGSREVIAVLGPNGSGKTTLFRVAMGLLATTAGALDIDGRPATRMAVADRSRIFGYVFQSPSQMLFARTVREELLFGPRNLGVDPATYDDLVADVLRRTSLDQLEGILDRPPLTLSFGQQKRLALAIALALRPPTLILDEPSAGQDHRTAERFMAEVGALPGLESIYLITHDVDLALTHADRILLLRDGEIVADGPPTAVIEDEDRWIACNLRPTTLLRANARLNLPPGRLLDAETLARRMGGAALVSPEVGGGGYPPG